MLGIFREELYSPNRVEDDAAILKATAEALRRRGYPVELLHPQDLSSDIEPTMTFAMCEGRDCLEILGRWNAMGYAVVNSPEAVRNCYRHRMQALLAQASIPVPKTLLIRTSETINGQFNLRRGLWVKRGDVHSTQPGDVELIFDRLSLEETLRSLRSRWVEQAVLQEHVPGDLIKFYGVLPQGWFRHFYHNPDKVSGFSFPPEEIRRTAETAAQMLGLHVYGGDIVVTETGHYLIDINSWPSFTVCREEASEQIASYLIRRYQSSTARRYGLQWRSA